MTDNEINVAVAECCGWTNITRRGTLRGTPPHSPEARETLPPFTIFYDAAFLAVHSLKSDEWPLFIGTLAKLTQANYHIREGAEFIRILFKATPRQLCLAFLKARGKWRDE